MPFRRNPGFTLEYVTFYHRHTHIELFFVPPMGPFYIRQLPPTLQSCMLKCAG